ncbi:hypothetical protein [Shewanella holmiensis]|uniref:Uncharacterized protein n=1 Tax=Shewanella holmiensis TaxID=2952222 RepID=A0A9X2WQN6_9GAMM|nr:hypothetical protein [Shewanella holmiensis]MCT7943317.1 hypothetical protein [Shewanella holmiensis]
MSLDGKVIDQVLARFGYQLVDVVEVGRLYLFKDPQAKSVPSNLSAILIDDLLYSLNPADFVSSQMIFFLR